MNPLTAMLYTQVALEAGAPDHRARRDRRARVGERELEQEERHERDAGVERCRAYVYVAGAPFRKKNSWPIQPVADAEHEREAERPEQQRAQARVDDALLQDVDHLTGPGEAGLEHHEAGLHEEHEEGRHEHPRRVRPIDHRGELFGRRPARARPGRSRWCRCRRLLRARRRARSSSPRGMSRRRSAGPDLSTCPYMSISRIPPVGSSGWRTGSD